MIKPDSLNALGAACGDSTFIGNVVRAICGQPVELTAAEEYMVAVIRADCVNYTERTTAQRQKAAQRQSAWRAKQKSALLQIVENGSPHNLKSPGRIAI